MEKKSDRGGVGLWRGGSVQIEAQRVRNNGQGNKRRIVHLNIKFDAAA